MEDKGFLSSEFGEPTLKRGGKRKRIYSVTFHGQRIMTEMKELRAGLWKSIPRFAKLSIQ